MKVLAFCVALVIGMDSNLLANGGAWQEGIPGTGTAAAAASDKPHKTDVTIEEEHLAIDLGPEAAAVEVRYRMHNTGARTQQDFFFPIERWGTPPGEDVRTPAELENYRITADGTDLKSSNVQGSKATTMSSGEAWQEEVPVIKGWKKSVIPFEKNQTREITIKYRARYAENDESVSDDSHLSDATFAYSLSPAATWKGPIGKGQIDVTISHPEPEDVSIEKPANRFKKLNDTHYQWIFEKLKPSLADDLRIVAHSKYDEYPTGYSEEDFAAHNSYVMRGNQYFLDNTDYDVVASSTLPPQGKHNYDVINIKDDPRREIASPWAEGVEGDGVGENVTLTVKRQLPLYGIMIEPGYYEYDNKEPWAKNNRVAALEITLNDEKTFTASIPDEHFSTPFLIRVPDYAKPVSKVKLVIKGVHPGTQFHDTCISLVRLRAILSQKPEVHPAR